MSAFNDGTCPKCKKRFGWTGKLTDRPPCPKCGHTIPHEELASDEKMLQEMEALLLARKKVREEKAKSVKDKAEYVLSQSQTRQHHCHWPGCNKQVPPAMWGCKAHWYRLPVALRNRIWRAYEPGQEVTLTPSKEYLEVAQEVQEWIQEHYQV